MNIIFNYIFCNVLIFSLSALQKAPLWNRQAREIGPVSRRLKVLDENFQPDQIQCCRTHQEKGTPTIYYPQIDTLPNALSLLHLIPSAAFRVSHFFLLPCFFILFTHPIQCSPVFQVKENKEKERLERRLLDELYKIFMDSDSFYYSMTYDLTNSVQRQGDLEKSDLPLWKQVWRGTCLSCIV